MHKMGCDWSNGNGSNGAGLQSSPAVLQPKSMTLGTGQVWEADDVGNRLGGSQNPADPFDRERSSAKRLNCVDAGVRFAAGKLFGSRRIKARRWLGVEAAL